MAKVQDITTTQVYKDVVERKPDTLDEIIGVAGVVKDVINDPVTKNLTNLQEKGIFDKALMSSRLKQFKANQIELERIDSEFGGSVYNYANARNKKAIEQSIAQYYNVGPDVKFTIGNPDMVYGEVLENMNKKSVEAIKKLKASQAALGVSGVDLKDVGTYLDEKHAAAFKDLQEQFTITGTDIMRQLFGKTPYNRASIDEMKGYISKQAYSKEFTKIEDVNNTYRTLFNFDPTVAAEFEEIIKNADLRFNVESKASPIKTRTIKGPKGNDIIETYKTIDTQYTDNKGVLQVESNEIVLTNEKQEFSLEGHNLMQKLILGDSGLQEYFRLVEEEGYSPRRAFDRLPRKYKKSMSDLNKEALYNDQFNNIATAFKDYKDLNYYEGTMGGQFGTTTLIIKKEVQEYTDYLENPNQYKKENDGKVPPRPSYFYKNIEEFARGQYNIGPVKSELSERNINTSANSYILDDSLSDNIRYQNFVGNDLVMGQNLNSIFEGNVAEKIEELNLKFNNGIKTNFVKGSSVYVNPNEPDVTPEELIELGLDDTLPAGNYKLGYDIKTDTLQLVNISGEQIEQPQRVVGEEPITKEGIYDKLLEVPGLGDAAEFVFGTSLNPLEKVLITGGGAYGTFKAGQAGVNPTARRIGMSILNNPKNKDAIKVVTDVTQKVNQANYGFKTKAAFNAWKNNLTPFQQSVFKSVGKSGKTINPTLLSKNFIPNTTVIRVPATGLRTIGTLAKNILWKGTLGKATTIATIASTLYNQLGLDAEDTEAEIQKIKDSQ